LCAASRTGTAPAAKGPVAVIVLSVPRQAQVSMMELSVEISRLLGRTEAVPTRGIVLRPILSDIVKRIGHWRRTRRAEQELFALDDRLLKDIGLCRSEIAGAVRGTPRIDKLTGDQQL